MELLLAVVIAAVCRRVLFCFGGFEPVTLEAQATLVPLIRLNIVQCVADVD